MTLGSKNWKNSSDLMKAVIVHGWGADSSANWFPWLKQELEKNGFDVLVPNMPNTLSPSKEEWVSHLKKVLPSVDENTYLIGHSLGCQTILRYLESMPEGTLVGGVVLVAGFVEVRPEIMRDPEAKKLADSWLTTSINFENVKPKSKHFLSMFSDNDRFVALEPNVSVFREQLGSEIILEHNRGHLMGEDSFFEMPKLLSAIIKFSRE